MIEFAKFKLKGGDYLAFFGFSFEATRRIVENERQRAKAYKFVLIDDMKTLLDEAPQTATIALHQNARGNLKHIYILAEAVKDGA